MKAIEGDIVHKEGSREAFRGVDCVIHCAALVSYRFPPDHEALDRINVTGTQNVVSLCVEMGIPRLVFCSTSEVTLTPYLGGIYTLIFNQTECKALPPSCDYERQLLLPGYPASKLRAEKLVLAANGRPLADGRGRLHTVALRPTLLYGEQDPRLLPSLIQLSEKMEGTLMRFAGPGGRQQITYVGNAAWAHLLAKDQLLVTRPGGGVSGLPIFITDDTPADDLLFFAQRVTARANLPPRCRISRWYMPALLAYLIAALLEMVVLIAHIPLSVSPRGAVSYLGSIVLYNRLRASLHLNYSPIFPPDESCNRANKYYTREEL
ncbi:3 beta-hydroxysteroid dehydrogenase/Delta 5--_4-isomerase type 2 isoform X2 [Cryptotermes secundus]|nr:3 beta-hydroxysteroid dehydrogenase/Delta 5-->4-isomerase type 2 isoform X2 [Cryptotermes secundus]